MEQLTLTPEEQRLLDLTAAPLTPERSAQLADFVLSEIHQHPPKSRRRRFGFLAAFLAALTLGGGVAAYAFVSRSEAPADPYLVFCYRDTTNIDRGDGWIGGTVVSGIAVDGTREPIDAVATCAENWSIGGVSAPGKPALKNTGNPVPAQLTACIDKKGYTIVLPADSSICTRLGLPSLR